MLRTLPLALLALAVPRTAAQGSWTQVSQLTAAAASAPHHFGRAIALSAPRALIGAPGLHGQPGRAYAFASAGATWTPLGELIANPSATDDDFGRSVALADTLGLVGAPRSGGAGRAFLFRDTSFGTWAQIAAFAGGAPGSDFGRTAALDAATAVVGAPGDGAVHVYVDGAAGWTAAQVLVPSVPAVDFGSALALAGDRLVVGAPASDLAFVFERSQGVWLESAVLASPVNAAALRFGASVALDAGRVLIGAPDAESAGGRAFVFELGPSAWSATVELAPIGGPGSGAFGSAVGISGAVAFVGAPMNGMGLGSAHVFTHGAAGWDGTQLIASGQTAAKGVFASAIAMSGGTALLNVGIDEGIPPFIFQGGYAGTVLVLANGSAAIQLHGEPPVLSLGAGGAQALSLDAGPAHAGQLYLALGSLSGTYPGTALGAELLPLNLDAYTAFTASQPNQPPLSGSFGILDAAGRASFGFALPPVTSGALAGLQVAHACLVLDPAGPELIAGCSNAAGLALVP